ncbi:MAG: hypothetical protein R3B81_05025 [bacterium]
MRMRVLAVSLLGLVASACSYNVKIDPNIDPTANISNQLPLRVGLYIPEETRGAQIADRADLDKYTFHVGDALVSIIAKSAQRIFRSVQFLDAYPTEQALQDSQLDLAMIAKVTAAQVSLNKSEGFFQDSAKGSAQLSVQSMFYGPDLVQVASVMSSGMGVASEGLGAFSTGKKEYSSAVESAVRNLGNDMVQQIYGNYDLRKRAEARLSTENPD